MAATLWDDNICCDMDNKIVPYELIDSERNLVYLINVQEKEIPSLDLDKNKRYRIILNLRDSNVQPHSKWDESVSAEHSNLGDLDADVSVWQPPGNTCGNRAPGPGATSSPQAASQATCVPMPSSFPQGDQCAARARGKTGAKWNKKSTSEFLKACALFKEAFAKKSVPDNIYKNISDILFSEHQLDYSWEQAKEKMRNLKRTFSEAKGGKHLGKFWDHFEAMNYLLSTGSPQDSEGLHSAGASGHMNNATYVIEGLHGAGASGFGNNDTYVIESEGLHSAGASGHMNNATYVLEGLRGAGASGFGNNDTYVIESEGLHGAGASGLGNNNCTYVSDLNNLALGDKEIMSDAEPNLYEDQEVENVPELFTLPNDQEVDEVAQRLPVQDEGVTIVDTAINLRSPQRKKSSNNNAVRKTPQKTPKRKVAQQQLVWSKENQEAFLKICLTKKNEVNAGHVPVRVWKDISEVLLQENKVLIAWDVCRAKFESLNKFLVGTLLPRNGILGGVKCPFFHLMCDIHDIPKEYVVPSDETHLPYEPITEGGTEMWPNHKVEALLGLYQDKKHYFDGTKSTVRHALLYAEIAADLANFGLNVTGRQCHAQMDTLKGVFKIEYDKGRQTGAAPSTWVFYSKMLQLFEGTATLEATYARSVGTSNEYTFHGAQVAEVERSTRTCPPVSSMKPPNSSKHVAPKGPKVPKTPIYKSRMSELQEKQLEQQNKLIEEIRLMRQGQEVRGDRRLDLLETLINKVPNPEK